jgi:hypothetical protein
LASSLRVSIEYSPGLIGSPTRNSIGWYFIDHDLGLSISYVPTNAIGTIGISVSTAISNPPGLKGANDPSLVRVPSGNNKMDLGISNNEFFANSRDLRALSVFLLSTQICPAVFITHPRMKTDLNSTLAIGTNQKGNVENASGISKTDV